MGFFGTIFEPIENLLHVVLQALYNVTDLAGFGSYGVAIVLLTILIKMLLYPLTVKQVKSMKAMQELSPKMKKIQEKYKDNPQVMQQKVGALYKEAGVNPLAGCLPLLIQMPILMACTTRSTISRIRRRSRLQSSGCRTCRILIRTTSCRSSRL